MNLYLIVLIKFDTEDWLYWNSRKTNFQYIIDKLDIAHLLSFVTSYVR